jgi:hypothetical protein
MPTLMAFTGTAVGQCTCTAFFFFFFFFVDKLCTDAITLMVFTGVGDSGGSVRCTDLFAFFFIFFFIELFFTL